MLGLVCAQVIRQAEVPVSDRKFPALTRRSGTQRARRMRFAYYGWRLGALVLVITQRATHYEGVLVHCSRVESPR